MRLLLYNIRYAVGAGTSMHMPLPGAGYILGNQTVLPEIIDFIKSADPDIVGLIEVDTGSMRSRMVNQAEAIAVELGMNSSYEIKYGTHSLTQVLPIIRKQGNAFLAAPRIHGETFHYFDTGIKRLIIELEMDDFAVFLVHLSLKYRHRHLQLRTLFGGRRVKTIEAHRGQLPQGNGGSNRKNGQATGSEDVFHNDCSNMHARRSASQRKRRQQSGIFCTRDSPVR